MSQRCPFDDHAAAFFDVPDDDPSHFYRRMQEEAPVYWSNQGFWFVTRYDLVREILLQDGDLWSRNPALNREVPAASDCDGAFADKIASGTMLDSNPPVHGRLRRLVTAAFNRRSTGEVTAQITGLVDERLALIGRNTTVDLLADFAEWLPTTVIGRMLGVPDADHARFREVTDAFVEFRHPNPSREVRRHTDRVFRDFAAYIEQLAEARRREPADDLMTHLVQAEDEGERLSHTELLAMVILLVAAGQETTGNLLANGVFTLLQHPDQFTRLVDNPDRVKPVTEAGVEQNVVGYGADSWS